MSRLPGRGRSMYGIRPNTSNLANSFVHCRVEGTHAHMTTMGRQAEPYHMNLYGQYNHLCFIGYALTESFIENANNSPLSGLGVQAMQSASYDIEVPKVFF